MSSRISADIYARPLTERNLASGRDFFGHLYDVQKRFRPDVGFRSVPTFFLTSSRYRAEKFCCLGTLVGTPLVGLIEYTSPKLQRLVTYKSSQGYRKAEQDIASLHFLSISRRLIGLSGRATYYPFERQCWKISELFKIFDYKRPNNNNFPFNLN